MIKNLIFFGFLLMLSFGCSKDDNTSEPDETVIPASEKFLNDIKDLDKGTNILSLEYNAEKKVERIKIQEDGLLIYGYDGNKISSLDAYIGESLNFTFSYDAEGHLSAFTQDDVVTQVTYNAAQNFYLYAKENGDEETIF